MEHTTFIQFEEYNARRYIAGQEIIFQCDIYKAN